MIGGVFVGMIMTPASMYMQLVVGAGHRLGGAVGHDHPLHRSRAPMRSRSSRGRRFTSSITWPARAWSRGERAALEPVHRAERMRSGSSDLADKIPTWVAPSVAGCARHAQLFHPAWVTPIGLMALGMFLQRVDHFGLGYVMYRLTSDVEKLPFPMAPVAAQGVTALADASGGQETWRWRVFSFGAMLGMAFAVDLPRAAGDHRRVSAASRSASSRCRSRISRATPKIFLPGRADDAQLRPGPVDRGMVLPFWAMVGSFVGLVIMRHRATRFCTRPASCTPGSRASARCRHQREHARFLFVVRPRTDGRDRGDRHHGTSSAASIRRHAKRGPRRLARPVRSAAGTRRLLDLGRLLASTSSSTTVTILTAYLLLRNAHRARHWAAPSRPRSSACSSSTASSTRRSSATSRRAWKASSA